MQLTVLNVVLNFLDLYLKQLCSEDISLSLNEKNSLLQNNIKFQLFAYSKCTLWTKM